MVEAGRVTRDNYRITAISCASSVWCLAVAPLGEIIAYRGSGWSALGNPAGYKPVHAVTCTSKTFCVALLADDAIIWHGDEWSHRIKVDNGRPTSVSCSDRFFCAAIDHQGNAMMYGPR